MGNFPPFSFCYVENIGHQPDLLYRLLYMSCKAVEWIFTTDKKVFLHDFHFHDETVNRGIAPSTVPDMGNTHGKVLWHSCCTSVLLDLTVSLDHLHSFPCLSGSAWAWDFPEKDFLLHHDYISQRPFLTSSLVIHSEQNTLNPRHRVPRKLLTAWKETKNLQEKYFMSLRGLTWVSLKKTLKGIILCYAGKQTLKRLAENPLMCLRGGDDNWDSSFFRTGQGDSSVGAGVLSRKM